MREISEDFINNLKNDDGLLNPIYQRVLSDNTLMLAIRENNINIYYRGGNLLKITEKHKGIYDSFFDHNYNKSGLVLPDLPKSIECLSDAKQWVKGFPLIKEVMDIYFINNSKPEREFQQLVVRENNYSTISNESEYFISDIEYAHIDIEINARFDMSAVRWSHNQRQNVSNCRVALIEMKYGDDALKGVSGILKHLEDFSALISNKERYSLLTKSIQSQFNQLDELELLTFNHSKKGTKVELSVDDKPEVIFIFANHNPRSSILLSVLNDPEIQKYGQSEFFDLKFFVSQFSGYALHSKCLIPLNEFCELLKN